MNNKQKQSEKVLLDFLLSFKEKSISITHETILEHCDIKRTSLIKVIKSFELTGVLKVAKVGRNIYVFNGCDNYHKLLVNARCTLDNVVYINGFLKKEKCYKIEFVPKD